MEDELNPVERERLVSIQTEIDPDPALERRIVDQLRRDGLLSRPLWNRWKVPAAIAAALLAGFIGGMMFPRHLTSPQPSREFMLLVHVTPSMRTDGQEARRVREYSLWARQLRDKLVDGEKLSDTVSSAGQGAAPSTIGGYFRVRARDRAEADAIARSCPHVRYGGWIEVREIERS